MARAKKMTAKQIEEAKATAAAEKAKAPKKNTKIVEAAPVKKGRAVSVEKVIETPAPKKATKVVNAEKVRVPSKGETAILAFVEKMGKMAKDDLATRLKELNNAYVKALKAKETTDDIRYEACAVRRLLGHTTYIHAR